jgi:hypothetical protein
MSLILEALRKLDREKPAEANRSTVLLAPLAWPATTPHRARFLWSALLLTAFVALGWFFARGTRPAVTPPAPPVSAAQAGAPNLTQPPQERATRPPSERTPRPVRSSRASAAPATRTDSAPAASLGTFRLTAVGDQEGASVAVINDRLLRVGDSLLGCRIVRIGATDVELEREADGHRFTIGL